MKMRYSILIGLVLAVTACDTKQDVYNTGVASPYFDGNVMEYLRSHGEDWDLTVQMIERAGLTDLFEGRVDTMPDITFFGPTSYSVFRYMMDSQTKKPDQGGGMGGEIIGGGMGGEIIGGEIGGNEGGEVIPPTPYYSVEDISPEECRRIILKHVVKGKHLKKDIKYRDKAYDINSPMQTGGTDFTCADGNIVRAYLEGSPYAGVPDAGPVTLNLYSISFGKMVPMASPDIQPENGVIHALNYDYRLDEI